MILVTKWFGVFLCEEETVRKFQLFDKDPKSVAKKLAAFRLKQTNGARAMHVPTEGGKPAG